MVTEAHARYRHCCLCASCSSALARSSWERIFWDGFARLEVLSRRSLRVESEVRRVAAWSLRSRFRDSTVWGSMHDFRVMGDLYDENYITLIS